MNRMSLAKRYGPLVAVVAIQLLIIATVPSKAPSQAAAVATGDAGVVAGPGGDVAAAGGGAGADAGGAAAGGGSAAAGSTGGATGAAGGGGAAGVPGAAASGDTSHCVNGREFDPAIAYWAPPCVPGTPGGPYPNNGGNTYQGVSKDTITIVDYLTNYGAEVNAILQAQGTLETYDQGVVLDKAFENFINSKYVLYGRKVKIIPYQGKCQSVPPQKSCLLPEMDNIVASYHPYIVMWNTTLCSECYAELAHNKTVAVGGIGFSDEFANAQAPYFYAAGESSTRIEKAFAEFWCKQMVKRPAKYSADANPAEKVNGKTRLLGVISTNDPDNEDTVKNVLYKELNKCGETDHHHEYFYDQDINTAASQTQAGIAAMNTSASDYATSVLCLCDSVAPEFLFQGESNNNYYPENFLADVQGMGNDNAAQQYDGSLACPKPQVGCTFDDAIGIVDSQPDTAPANMAGPKIFKLGGGQGDPPTTPYTTTSLAKIWVMIANLLQNTGPNLTPANMQARAVALPPVGGGASGLPLLGFSKGNWSWTQDARLVYWSAKRTSPYNDKPGAYVNIDAKRYNLTEYANVDGGPNVPPPSGRS